MAVPLTVKDPTAAKSAPGHCINRGWGIPVHGWQTARFPNPTHVEKNYKFPVHVEDPLVEASESRKRAKVASYIVYLKQPLR